MPQNAHNARIPLPGNAKMSGTHALLISDDFEWNELLQQYLSGEGLRADMLSINEAGATLASVCVDYALVVLDTSDGDERGLGMLKMIRRCSRMPVVALAPLEGHEARVRALEHGADDCLSKACGPAELCKRLRVQLRHLRECEQDAADASVRFLGRLAIWSRQRRVEWNGRPLDLTITEFRLLGSLASAGERPVPKSELSLRALGRPYSARDRDVEHCVGSVSNKLALASDGHASIRPVFREGYLLVRE